MDNLEQKIQIYHNEKGPDIGVTSAAVIEKDGCYFRDLAGTGELLPYEDWRLTARERALDLAKRLSIEEIAGLMLYSPHQMVPSPSEGPFSGTYDGKNFSESGREKWDMTDQQKRFLDKDHVRHVLAAGLESAEIAAKWSNRVQAFAESLPWGIPVNFSSDPRHGAGKSSTEFKMNGGDVSRWPEGMGISATFDPSVCEEFSKVVAKEYRAMGITTALSPQIDLATEPRWMRFEDTFGTHPDMVTEMARIYSDYLQETEESPDGWGKESVCAMAKHWPGGGPCEAGRDAHYGFGKFAVYPGDHLKDHMQPFTEGAFQLKGKTGCVSAVMPYYTISWQRDQKNHQEVGNSYSEYLIKDQLRGKYGFDGVVCTDWGITGDPNPEIDAFGSRCYGVENLTVAQRHYLAIRNGVDQFGGNSEIQPILEAYQLGCGEIGEEAMRQRMEESAVRLLLNIFRCGLFENPYLDPEKSKTLVGCTEHCDAGYEAQLKSVVLLKNQGVLPIKERKKVYIPNRHINAKKSFMRGMDPARDVVPASQELVGKYYDQVNAPEEADFALIFIESPLCNGGYNGGNVKNGENGYEPISLQYRPYTADTARPVSLAGGDFREKDSNRSYRGKTVTPANESDLDLILNTRKAMPGKPIIVCLRMHNPTVVSEFEPYVDGILVEFGVQKQVLFDLVSGRYEPSALLPVQFPANMETVEAHCEDVPFDMEPYRDQAGHAYDFTFGMNWSGVIEDERTGKYSGNTTGRSAFL
ncbi:MAG: glycoside hydrolase family 3 C-terminal domain-containing protein [Lachnospiraceae bacterium]|nr:glycoside hydrolase family 3 C-terminal domain-containing protein [Lachnospiraceae bacterium]